MWSPSAPEGGDLFDDHNSGFIKDNEQPQRLVTEKLEAVKTKPE
jgi:hypothetical protein